MKYNGLLHEQYQVPVHSAVVLLRKQADEPALNGRLSYETQGGRAGLDFRFEVTRIWQRPAMALLVGGLGMVPLAPLGESCWIRLDRSCADGAGGSFQNRAWTARYRRRQASSGITMEAASSFLVTTRLLSDNPK